MYIRLIPLCCLYCLSSGTFLYDILRTYRRSNTLSMKVCCQSMYLLIEGIVPLIIFYAKMCYDKEYSNVFLIDYSIAGIDALYVMWIFSLIGYFAITFACNTKNFIKLSITNSHKSPNKYNDGLLLPSAIITLCIGVVSMHLWTRAFGGIEGFIMQANTIRSGRSNITNSYAFFKHTARCVIISSYALFIILRYKKQNRFVVSILWGISAAYSIMFLLCSDGRLTAGFYFLTYAIINVKIGNKKYNTKKIIISFISIIIIIAFMMKMDDITYYIRSGVWNNVSAENEISTSFIGELMYIYNSEQFAIMNHKVISLQIINDLGYGLFAWLPTKFTPSAFLRIWQVNTNLINRLSTGEIPFGIIAQGYYDLRIFGVFILPYIYGRIIKRIDLINTSNTFENIIFSAFFSIMLRTIAYGMVYDFVLGTLNIFIFYCIYKFMNIVFFKRRNFNDRKQIFEDFI